MPPQRISDKEREELITACEANNVQEPFYYALLDLRDDREQLKIAVEALEYYAIEVRGGGPTHKARTALDRIKQLVG